MIDNKSKMADDKNRKAKARRASRNKGGNGGKGSGWISKAARLAIYIRDNFTCLYCGRDMKNDPAYLVSLDHLICREDGGNHEPENLATCCTPCNSKRGNRQKWEDYVVGGAIERIKIQVALKINLDLAKSIISGKTSDPRIEAKRG